MQNFPNQTESIQSYSTYQLHNQQQQQQNFVDNAVNAASFGSQEANNSANDESLILDTSFQSDSNSTFFNTNNLDYVQNNNFSFNDKYSPSIGNQLTDEISQTSNCSSQFDDSLSNNNSNLSANNLKTPIKMTNQQQLKNIPEETHHPTPSKSHSGMSKTKKNEVKKQMYEMSNDPERKTFLDKLFDFNEKRNPGMVPCPSIAKNLIDLFKVYKLVQERKGFVEVCKNLEWKEIAQKLGFQITSTTAYSLRKNYGKYVLPYECVYDLNNEYNPDELFEKMDKETKQKRKKKPASQSSTTNAANSSNTVAPVATSPANIVNPANSLNSGNPVLDQQQPQPQQQFVNNYFQPQSQHSPQSKSVTNQITFKPNHSSSSNSNQFPESSVYNPQMIFNSNNSNNSTNEEQHQFMNNSINNQMPNECALSNYEMPNESASLAGSNGSTYEMPMDSSMAAVNYNQYHNQQHQQSVNQQQMINRNFNNSNTQYYSQYQIDAQLTYTNSNQQALKPNNQPQQPLYYSDTNQFNSSYSSFNDQMSSYAGIYYQDNINNDARVSVNRAMSSGEQKPQFQSKPCYVLNSQQQQPQQPIYDYNSNIQLQQQQHQLGSPQLNSSYSYQHSKIQQQQQQQQSQQQNLDSKQFEKWQMNHSKNWKQTCANYPQQQQHLQQQTNNNNSLQLMAVESPMQKASQSQYLHNQLVSHKEPPLMPPYYPQQSSYYYSPSSKIPQPFPTQSPQLNHLPMQNHTAFNLTQTHHKNSKLIDQIPPGCVESLVLNYSMRPHSIAKSKLTPKDCPHLNLNDLVLSLKSGLVSESTNALNNLIIYSSNDSSNSSYQIKLSKYPQLLPLLLEYLTKFLNELFPDIFNDESSDKKSIEQNGLELSNGKLNEDPNDSCILDLDEKCVVKNNESDFILTGMHPKKRRLIDDERDNKDNNDCDNEMEVERLKKFKNSFPDEYENEAKVIEQCPLNTCESYYEDVKDKCTCIFNIIRNLSFIHDNGYDLMNKQLLLIIGKFLLYSHQHNEKKTRNNELIYNLIQNGNQEEIDLQLTTDLSNNRNSEPNRESWWFETLTLIQDDIFVILTNICSFIDFDKFDEKYCRPILEGLLHWTLCPSSVALDNFASTSIRSNTPKRLALECLAKLSLRKENVDLILQTPPLDRKGDFKEFATLANLLSGNEDQVIRDFALKLLDKFIEYDTGVATAISCSSNIVAQLIHYLEQYKELKINQVNQLSSNSSNVNSLNLITCNMALRASKCLMVLAALPEVRSKLFPYQEKLISLATCEVLDKDIVVNLSHVAYDYSANEKLNLEESPANLNST